MPKRYKKKFILPNPGYDSPVTVVAISKDGKHIASAYLDGRVLVHEISSGDQLYDFAPGPAVFTLVWPRSDSSSLLFGTDGGTLVSASISSREVETSTFQAHRAPIKSLSPIENAMIVASCAGSEVRIWKQVITLDGKEHWRNQIDLPTPPSETARVDDACVAIGAQWMKVPTTLDNDCDGLLLVSYQWHGIIGAFDLSPDRSTLAVHGFPRSVRFDVYDVKARIKVRSLEVEQGDSLPYLPVKYVHDGFAVAGGSYAGNVRIWDLESGDRLQVLRHGNIPIRTIAAHYVKESQVFLIATGASNGQVTLWDTVVENETDSLEPVKVPSSVYWGLWAVGLQNFLLTCAIVLILAIVCYHHLTTSH
ncbi:WD40 repeat-like protein [Artomyces pyxidatus]|uniref:WD40 repeat-like protein n=1 Tax=Artomyces pyxidatus TaxID=48021 RepID=A0ACB8SL73_9AGAM|nr:WD40 repeat-like protein [Artomyces pyxidatus]